jgi:hypothetical protein
MRFEIMLFVNVFCYGITLGMIKDSGYKLGYRILIWFVYTFLFLVMFLFTTEPPG